VLFLLAGRDPTDRPEPILLSQETEFRKYSHDESRNEQNYDRRQRIDAERHNPSALPISR